jgi:entericidin B
MNNPSKTKGSPSGRRPADASVSAAAYRLSKDDRSKSNMAPLDATYVQVRRLGDSLTITSGVFTMRKIITLSIVAAALAVSACNTISGVGRDVSAAGSAVSSGAESAKN